MENTMHQHRVFSLADGLVDKQLRFLWNIKLCGLQRKNCVTCYILEGDEDLCVQWVRCNLQVPKVGRPLQDLHMQASSCLKGWNVTLAQIQMKCLTVTRTRVLSSLPNLPNFIAETGLSIWKQSTTFLSSKMRTWALESATAIRLRPRLGISICSMQEIADGNFCCHTRFPCRTE